MPRIFTTRLDTSKPQIDKDAVIAFFEQRSQKIAGIGPVRAVIYQDKHPDLAEKRDRAEKHLLKPLLGLNGRQRLLDIGCGTGRWASELALDCVHYHGIDISPGLISYASEHFKNFPNCRFSVASADSISLESLGEIHPFEVVLCSGVLIYLNDEDVVRTLDSMAMLTASDATIVLREPLGLGHRLTVKDHFSTDLEQTYNAIYRTEAELREIFSETIFRHGFSIEDTGAVFSDSDLNNRTETQQRWFLIRRRR